LTGIVNLTIKPGSNAGTVMRLRGKGAANGAGGHGDLLVRLMIHVQEQADDELRNLLKRWKGREKKPSRPSSL
ncbi:MAG: DnaJ C-terminal domain-containing protein, partial [Caulobacterales bacterium]